MGWVCIFVYLLEQWVDSGRVMRAESGTEPVGPRVEAVATWGKATRRPQETTVPAGPQGQLCKDTGKGKGGTDDM